MFKGALPGFRDFYPQELAERAYIMSTWREVARRYAFVEYDGPPLEPLELYTRKSGDEIVGQLYSFVDKGEREVALRPEMTPTVARMVAARANALRKPVRWFSMPQLFRYERQQKGRLREHYQLNVDLFGASEVAADAELLAVALDIMRAFGLTPDDIVARVSDRRILTAYLASLGVTAGGMDAAYGVIDKLERTPRDVSAERLAALGLAPSAVEAVLGIQAATLADVARVVTGADAAVVKEFAQYQRYLEALGVGAYVRFDLSIVRGLAYYTGIVFELFDRSGEFRAVAGGGRYDTLLASLGGADLPALGFGMGDVVLGELLRARGLMKAVPERADVWLAAAETEPLERVMREAAARRGAGQSVEYALRPQSLSKQKKAAQASGAQEFVTLSTDDGRNG
ncbi:MAG: histidine--tRNA ligase [Gemmatimonadaceae bacterium]|nr:histidine--tRNA ligase [Gemmatimonadaceae bacterium]